MPPLKDQDLALTPGQRPHHPLRDRGSLLAYPPGRGQPVTKLDQEKTAAVQAVVTRAFGVSRTTIYKALNTTETGQP